MKRSEESEKGGVSMSNPFVVFIAIVVTLSACVIVSDQRQTIEGLSGAPLMRTAKAAPVAMALCVVLLITNLVTLVQRRYLRQDVALRDGELALLKRELNSDFERGRRADEHRLFLRLSEAVQSNPAAQARFRQLQQDAVVADEYIALVKKADARSATT